MTNAVGQTNRENEKKEQRWNISNPTRVSPRSFFSSLPAMRIAHAILLQNSTGGALPS